MQRQQAAALRQAHMKNKIETLLPLPFYYFIKKNRNQTLVLFWFISIIYIFSSVNVGEPNVRLVFEALLMYG